MAKLALYVRASHRIGMGHLSRTLAFAQQLDERRFDYSIVCNQAAKIIFKKIGFDPSIFITDREVDTNRGYTHAFIDMMFSNQKTRVENIVYGLVKKGVQPIVIDSMPPDELDFFAQSVDSPITLVTPYLDAHLFRPEPASWVNWLNGAEYSIVSKPYIDIEDKQLVFNQKRILFVCGGSDPKGLSFQMLSLIKNKLCIPVTIIIGPMFDKELKGRLSSIARNSELISLKEGLSQLADEILLHSHVIGQVGLIRYECACLGRHGIYLAQDDRYKKYYENFNNRGVAEIFFATSSGSEKLFFERIIEEATDDQPATLNDRALKNINRRGVSKLVDQIL